MVALIITEKPSAMEHIAKALAEDKPVKEKGAGKAYYYVLQHKGKTIYVGCAVGHLYNLKETEGKGWTYPVFQVEWIESYKLNKNAAYTKQYLDTLQKLIKQADEVYNGCDFDLEGETIFNVILEKAVQNRDAKRMKFSTMTKDELKRAFEHALPHIDNNMAEAGKTRHVVDYYFGINLSRALTLAIKHASNRFKIMSSGRVQGPALKILAEKEKEILAFQPRPYSEILAEGSFPAAHEKQPFFNQEEAKKIHNKIKKEKSAMVKAVSRNEFVQPAPHPFDLTSLQLEAYRCLKIAPKTTLELAQTLYTNAYISYPRTSSHQLPAALNLKKIIQDLSKQEKYAALCKELLKTQLQPNNGKKSDPAHPAIHPTGVQPEGLSLQESNLYDLIVRRTLATFAPPAKRETLTIKLAIKDEPFMAQGTRTTEKAWHTYYGRFAKFKETELPVVKEGQNIPLEKISLLDKETQPPKRFTPASIIKEMEKHGLGTKATRAAIIESLYQRNYTRENSIAVTTLGMKTIETLEKYCPEILDEQMTRSLEKEMEAIRKGKKTKDKVILHAKQSLKKILAHFKENEIEIGKALTQSYEETQKQESIIGKCNLCEKDLRILYSRKNSSYFIACSGYPKCTNTFSVPKNSLPKPTQETCEECHFPLVMIIRKGKRPFKYCINRSCKLKEEWLKNRENNVREQETAGRSEPEN